MWRVAPAPGWLHAFLEDEVVPQAERVAGLGLDPTPLLAVAADVLGLYAEALKPREPIGR